MKNLLLFTALAAAVLPLAACSDDKPTRVVHETRVVHHYRSSEHTSTSSNPSDFEPVQRPATYSH